MIWYLFAAVVAIMLLQQAASSSAFAVVLRVTPVTCPWTLQTSGPHVYCTLTRTTTQKYKLGLSHRGSLLKGVAVQGVLYQSILNAKLTGRKKLDRKMCTSNRDDCKLENTVKQRRFKHLRELHKEWTEAGVSASRVTTLRHLQEKSYQATSETETSSEASYLS